MTFPRIPPWLDLAAAGLALGLLGFELTSKRRGRPALALAWLVWAVVFGIAALLGRR